MKLKWVTLRFLVDRERLKVIIFKAEYFAPRSAVVSERKVALPFAFSVCVEEWKDVGSVLTSSVWKNTVFTAPEVIGEISLGPDLGPPVKKL